MLALLLVIAFIVVPIAELAIIIAIGGQIGWLWTVVLLLADAILGSLLVRWQGRTAWRRFTEALQAGRPPARETIDGALVLLGGAFLLTPGFISDLLGVVLLLPPTRAVVRKVLARRLLARMTASMMGPGPRPGTPARPEHDYDVEGTAVDVERRRLEDR